MVTAYIYNSGNVLVAKKAGTFFYVPTTGSFKGTIDMQNSLPTGNYLIKLKADSYLRRLISGIQPIVAFATNPISDAILVTGDIHTDNIIDILDYNDLMNCYSGITPTISLCIDAQKMLADLNDDGNVNQVDYNLLIREIGGQRGD
jgi:uncharacterized protein YuzB (UPF0349 family)